MRQSRLSKQQDSPNRNYSKHGQLTNRNDNQECFEAKAFIQRHRSIDTDSHSIVEEVTAARKLTPRDM